jgi:hypothetical protein
MLTLTVDRKNFGSPEAAYEHVVGGKGYVRRLMHYLELGCWAWVMEFQGATGEGWPHWHVLIDLNEADGHRIDLARVWRLWRDKWGIGSVHLKFDAGGFPCAAAAVNYATKYLTKLPEKGYPAWVVRRQAAGTKVRLCGGSKLLGPLVSPKRPSKPSTVPDSDTGGVGLLKRKSEPRPMVELLAACRQRSTVLRVIRDAAGEVVNRERVGELAASPRELLTLLAAGEVVGLRAVDHGHGGPGRVTFDTFDAVAAVGTRLVTVGFTGAKDEAMADREAQVTSAVGQPWVDLRFLRKRPQPAGDASGTAAAAPRAEPADVPFSGREYTRRVQRA